MKNFILKSYAIVEKLLLPYLCVLCDNDCENNLFDLCNVCQKHLPYLSWDIICFQCGSPLKKEKKPLIEDSCIQPQTLHCGSCLSLSPYYDQTLPIFYYDLPIREMIHAIKFQGKLLYSRLLTKLMIEVYQAYYKNNNLPDLIIPVPLFKKRLQQRGFNQAKEIAQFLAKTFSIPLKHFCSRIKNTLPQANIGANLRQTNVKDAFICKNSLAGKHVVLIDDVVTTGHTINAVSKVLKKAGAKKITVWCVAKTALSS